MRLPLVALWLLATLATSFLTLLVAAKDVAIAILFMTCGLGIPLLFAPTLAAYLLCLGPAVWTWGTRHGPLGVAVSVLAVVAVALAPSWLSEGEAAAELARVTAGDVLAPQPAAPPPRTLEIVRPSEENPNLDRQVFGGDTCGAACRALLLGGEVDWIRVVTVPWSPPGRTPTEEGRVRLVRAAGADCTTDPTAVADADCVIYVADVDEQAGLVLRFEDGHAAVDDAYPGRGWAKPGGWRRVTATVAGVAGPVLRRTEARLGVVFAPTVLSASLQGTSSNGIEANRSLRRFGEVTLAGALRELGYPLARLDAELARAEVKPAPMAGPPDEEATRRVISVLDLPGDAAFPQAQQQTVADWLAAARAWSRDGGWTEPRVEVVRRIASEPRLENAWSLDQIVERSPTVAAAVLPDVIARTEALGLPRHAPWRQAWYGLIRGDASVLHPHAERIAALVDAHPDPLVQLSGRLGLDPSRWLLPLDRADDPEGLDGRLAGACRAETAWSALLVGHLRRFLTDLDVDAPSGADRGEAAGAALARHGDVDGARERLLALGKDGERAWRRIDGQLRRGASEALCR